MPAGHNGWYWQPVIDSVSVIGNAGRCPALLAAPSV
jgi:hypothetical protein